MSWLRIDDSFDTHPKILGLKTDGRRWTWQRILIYTCRHGVASIPAAISEVIPKATPAFLRDCVALGLLDLDEDGVMSVHHWSNFNGKNLEKRVAEFVEANPSASANEVHRAVGGTRNIVLAEVARIRAATGTEPVRPAVRPYQQTGTATGTESGTRARAPVPSRPVLRTYKALPNVEARPATDNPDDEFGDGRENLQQIGRTAQEIIDAEQQR